MMAGSKRLVVKLGSSSVTNAEGRPDVDLLGRIAAEISEQIAAGWDVVVVSSGAVTAGWAAIGGGAARPEDLGLLQAISAVGQHRLMSLWADAFEACGHTVGQVLLARLGEADREQYLNAQQTFAHLFNYGVVPIVNENDAVADDEIRFGDNDRLAALVAHLIGADRFVMLTDAPGLLTADPRLDDEASLIEEVTEIDRSLEEVAGGPGAGATGGMSSKLAAARIATWSGVETVIADARTPGVLAAINDPARVVGTRFKPRSSRLGAHRLWIAFGLGTKGRVTIDAGAVRALVLNGGSLLDVGVIGCDGAFVAGDAIEVVDATGALVAKGLARIDAASPEVIRSSRNPEFDGVVIHRDDMVVFARADSDDE
jgi:glutamate 5-kinase